MVIVHVIPNQIQDIKKSPPPFLLIHCKLTWHCKLFQSLNKLKQYKTWVEKLIISSSLFAYKKSSNDFRISCADLKFQELKIQTMSLVQN